MYEYDECGVPNVHLHGNVGIEDDEIIIPCVNQLHGKILRDIIRQRQVSREEIEFMKAENVPQHLIDCLKVWSDDESTELVNPSREYQFFESKQVWI